MEAARAIDFHHLEMLRRTHPAWRLLVADHAPLIIGFLHASFVFPNVRTLPQVELISALEDYLFPLREGANLFPQPAASYIETWASDERAWLRKYYPLGSDEPHFDITPATERAIAWILSLEQRAFVGTESRLMTVFELLRQIVEGSETDPIARIAELEKRKTAIEADIHRIASGHVALMDPTQIRDRFLQMASTARELLSDFRQVEQNFRALDRTARERIATWESGKGALLQEIFGERDAIADSDQGKSFRAFWDFLMSPARQEELSDMLHRAFALEPVQEISPDPRLMRIHYDWLGAGEVAQRTVAKLSEQLRRLLDDRVHLENRRIMQLIRELEQHALAVRENAPGKGFFMEIDESAPEIALPMDRPLFRQPFKAQLSDTIAVEGDDEGFNGALFDQIYVDKERLAAHIRKALQTRDQVSLAELVAEHPLEHGLAEIIVYFSLATEDRAALIDDAGNQRLAWTDSAGVDRRAAIPLVLFTRRKHIAATFTESTP
jgi:Protein of unknown function (DUF3375)